MYSYTPLLCQDTRSHDSLHFPETIHRQTQGPREPVEGKVSCPDCLSHGVSWPKRLLQKQRTHSLLRAKGRHLYSHSAEAFIHTPWRQLNDVRGLYQWYCVCFQYSSPLNLIYKASKLLTSPLLQLVENCTILYLSLSLLIFFLYIYHFYFFYFFQL